MMDWKRLGQAQRWLKTQIVSEDVPWMALDDVHQTISDEVSQTMCSRSKRWLKSQMVSEDVSWKMWMILTMCLGWPQMMHQKIQGWRRQCCENFWPDQLISWMMCSGWPRTMCNSLGWSASDNGLEWPQTMCHISGDRCQECSRWWNGWTFDALNQWHAGKMICKMRMWGKVQPGHEGQGWDETGSLGGKAMRQVQ